MTVYNLINSNGNATANQFIIEGKDYIAFQSYRSRVCEIREGGLGFYKVVVFGRHWDYSRTTMKHLAEFLRQNGLYDLVGASEIRKAFDRGYVYNNENIAVWYDDTMI